MSVSYQAPLTYNQNGYQAYQQPKKKTCAGGAIAGATLGAVTGGVIAARSNPYITKNGEVVEDFAKKAYQNFIDGGNNLAKKIQEQTINIIDNIKKVNNADELRELFNKNKDAAEEYCKRFGQDIDKFISTVTEGNLKNNKISIKEWFNSDLINAKLNSFKNQIRACYDAQQKKFIQVPEVAQETYDAIIKAAKGGNGAKIAKAAGIVGVAGAAIGWGIHSLARSIKTAKAEH